MDRSMQISYSRLRRVLETFGYAPQTIEGGRIVFSHSERSLLIVLPELQSDNTVRPIDLISVRNTLINDGVVRDEEGFEALFRIKKGDQLIWTEPRTKRQIKVTAASGETSDGMVIIKQKGTFSPCPVKQLTRVEDMTEPTVKPAKVELRCKRNADGSYNGGSYLNGKQLVPATDYTFHNGDCDEVKRVYRRLHKDFDGADISVIGDCKDCLEGETA
jgi:hypothetical protein